MLPFAHDALKRSLQGKLGDAAWLRFQRSRGLEPIVEFEKFGKKPRMVTYFLRRDTPVLVA